MGHSQIIENYLKAIYKLSEGGIQIVTTTQISERIKTKAATVTDMIKKLHEKKLIKHEPYAGVTITDRGIKLALQIIRKHRLWEAFLVEKLNFGWHEVHEAAEQLEHVESDLLIERLDKFLGYPKFDPHGDPIPDSAGKISTASSKTLSQLNTGQKGKISGVINHSTLFLQHLDKNKLIIGTEVSVVEKTEFDKSLRIKINNASPIQISNEVASNLLIK